MLRIVILFVAITAGGACIWLVMSGKPAQPEIISAPQMQVSEILVASVDLAPGHIVSEKDLRWQSWPQEAVSGTYLNRRSKPDAVASLKGLVVRSRFISGEPVMEEKLSRTGSGILASMLPPGKRAVAIRVSAESAAGGFVLPNDKVDVIHAMTKANQSGDPESLGKTILTNIRVLAIDQKSDDAKGNATVIGKTATLELSAEQAEIITAAQATGAIFLSLRSATDGDDMAAITRSTSSSIQVYLGENNEKVRVQ